MLRESVLLIPSFYFVSFRIVVIRFWKWGHNFFSEIFWHFNINNIFWLDEEYFKSCELLGMIYSREDSYHNLNLVLKREDKKWEIKFYLCMRWVKEALEKVFTFLTFLHHPWIMRDMGFIIRYVRFLISFLGPNNNLQFFRV